MSRRIERGPASSPGPQRKPLSHTLSWLSESSLTLPTAGVNWDPWRCYKDLYAKPLTAIVTNGANRQNPSFGHSVIQNGKLLDNEGPKYVEDLCPDAGSGVGLAEETGPGEGHWPYSLGKADDPGETGFEEDLESPVALGHRGGYHADNTDTRPADFDAVAFDEPGEVERLFFGEGRGDLAIDVDPASHSERTGKTSCGHLVIIAECGSGHVQFAKRVYCGREWCETCGQDRSASHKRRMARVLPKTQQLATVGYFVIEFPNFYRQLGERGLHPDVDDGEPVHGWCYSKPDLRATTNAVGEVLFGKWCGRRGRVGGHFARGMGRWHWFGEQGWKWNPHLNVLVDGGYLERDQLERVKAELRSALNCPDLIVNYSYRDTPAKIVHTVRYVTRATFKEHSWNPYMAHELWNFRNVRWWGKWKDDPVWALGEAEAEGEDVDGLSAVINLQAGICPDCGHSLRVLHLNKKGEPVYWTKPVDAIYLDFWDAEEIAGSGYYRIRPGAFTGERLSAADFMRLEQLRVEAQGKPSASLDRRSFRELMGMPVDDLRALLLEKMARERRLKHDRNWGLDLAS